MKNNHSRGKESKMKRTEKQYDSTSNFKKLLILVFYLCIIIYLFSQNKYAQREKLLKEEQGIKYYFVGEEGDYSFKKAALTVYPNKKIKKEIIGNKADLTITRKREDEWTVDLEEMVPDYGLNGKKFYFTESIGFSCKGEISEESVIRGRTFHDVMKDYHNITTGFISIDEIKEIVDNGERISAELNVQSSKK